jgi:xylan 1,4-beta-xylosidase
LPNEAGALTALNFTGAWVGMACQDLAGMANPADFDFFEY